MNLYASYEDACRVDSALCSAPDETENRVLDCLSRASRAVDALTFNRIPAAGFARLTDFQREIVTEVTARLAIWQAEHGDALSSPVTGYSINGVSTQFGTGVGVQKVGGVLIPRELYALLEQTGLCCRRL